MLIMLFLVVTFLAIGVDNVLIISIVIITLTPLDVEMEITTIIIIMEVMDSLVIVSSALIVMDVIISTTGIIITDLVDSSLEVLLKLSLLKVKTTRTKTDNIKIFILNYLFLLISNL